MKLLKEAVLDSPDKVRGAYYFPQWPAVHKAFNDTVTKAVTGKREDIAKVLAEGAPAGQQGRAISTTPQARRGATAAGFAHSQIEFGGCMAAITLSKLNKHYGSLFHAVKDVDLEIADKEFVALVGPSGCGKSTTLRMIAGLEDISSGEIRIGEQSGQPSAAARPRRRHGVPELRALSAHERLRQSGLRAAQQEACREPRSRRRSTAPPSMLGLHELLQRKPRQLSGGQQQRVALGRCIVRNPQVFLFDEPLSTSTPSCAPRCASRSSACTRRCRPPRYS